MMTISRLRKIGWAVVLLVCCALYGALHLRVNAVKSEVLLAERKIVSLQREKLLLETEFETRSNQQQLSNWNAVEFGYVAPSPEQYLEGERQLAQFGLPRAKGAPEPIRVASAAAEDEGPSFPALIASPAKAAEMPEGGIAAPVGAQELSTRLSSGVARVSLDAKHREGE